ncbi:c-type cytochrome [Luteimonas sp. 50]|uniref:C-type cytochrome n=1 Tax=Cognatiluteimonas sedimenti TaxID=2927791 RepID=A0ABT0A172_9GAMM|nr:c-type cytochrome [Lysobacter sedimenti]MCJ0824730.1 c-type cytochrome [Lysobacter sedimenti]
MTKTTLAIALLAATAALVACSPAGRTPAEHSSADRNAGHTTSSAGLPAGHAAAGETLAGTKNAKTGQACVDCHGAGGNAPIDPTYPKLGGQYHDYIAHSLQMYRDGERAGSPTSDLMAGQARDLSDQQIADLAAYFGSQPAQLRDLHGIH